jgi:mycofactocin precursor
MDHEQRIEATREHDEAADEHADELVEELLIEEISIDGMCGVY